jgi:hypothetical protein
LSPPAEWAPGSPPIAPRAINWAAQDTIRDDRKQRRGEQELQRPARIHCLARRAFPRRESPSTNARSDRPRLSAQGRGHRAWTRQSGAARPAAHGCAQGAERARCDGFRRSHARSSASEILVPRPPAMAPAVPASIGPTPLVVAVSATAPNASPRQDGTARNEGPRSPTERRQSWTSPMSCQTSYAKKLQRHRLAASPRSNLQTKGSPKGRRRSSSDAPLPHFQQAEYRPAPPPQEIQVIAASAIGETSSRRESEEQSRQFIAKTGNHATFV